MDTPRVNHFSYLGDEMVMQQFTLLAENVQKALPNAENEGVQANKLTISKPAENAGPLKF